MSSVWGSCCNWRYTFFLSSKSWRQRRVVRWQGKQQGTYLLNNMDLFAQLSPCVTSSSAALPLGGTRGSTYLVNNLWMDVVLLHDVIHNLRIMCDLLMFYQRLISWFKVDFLCDLHLWLLKWSVCVCARVCFITFIRVRVLIAWPFVALYSMFVQNDKYVV